jgi:uncharacterized protein YbjT (DUF2867 family)
VFGASDSFLNRFAAMATMAPALPLIGGGKTQFQPVYVGDVAEAVARAVIRGDAAGRTFELGGPTSSASARCWSWCAARPAATGRFCPSPSPSPA